MEYHRIVDGIAPDDPVFNEDKVRSRMDEYCTDLRKGDVKDAVKAIEHLRKAIGGRGRPPAIQVRLERTGSAARTRRPDSSSPTSTPPTSY